MTLKAVGKVLGNNSCRQDQPWLSFLASFPPKEFRAAQDSVQPWMAVVRLSLCMDCGRICVSGFFQVLWGEGTSFKLVGKERGSMVIIRKIKNRKRGPKW